MAAKNGHETLTDFKRDTSRFLNRLRRTKKPVVLTVNGRAEIVIQEAASYQDLLRRIEHLETIAALKEGLEDIKAGRTYPADQVLDEIARKHGFKSARKSSL